MGVDKKDRVIKSLYGIWKGIRQRCNNSKCKYYKRYGARGIKICPQWDSFEQFVKDLGAKPNPRSTIDRIDNNGNYEPSNIRWASYHEQAGNRSDSKIFTYNGKTKCLKAHCIDLGVTYPKVKYRIRRGWTLEEALTIPTYTGGIKVSKYKKSMGSL